MTKLTAIIIDDERLARANLKKLLEPFTHIDIVDEAGSCKTAIQAINRHKPQIIFLDIQLMGETGFDILDKIDNNIQVVFVTAYDEYAIRAFEINAVDYLLKPVNPERLEKTINRITKQEEKKVIFNQKFDYHDAVYVKLNSHTSTFLAINSIVFISTVGNYTKLTGTDGKNYMVLKTLKQWEEELPKEHFIRIHRASIVNIECILRIEKYAAKYHRLYLKNMDEPVEISRRYMANLKNNYKI